MRKRKLITTGGYVLVKRKDPENENLFIKINTYEELTELPFYKEVSDKWCKDFFDAYCEHKPYELIKK